MFPLNPVFENVVTLAPTCAICAKFVQLLFRQRSILNPSSLVELSVHDRLICVADTAMPFKLVGAFGTGNGVGVGVGGGAVGLGLGEGDTSGVGVGVGVGAPPQVGNLNDPIRVRQLKLLVVA